MTVDREQTPDGVGPGWVLDYVIRVVARVLEVSTEDVESVEWFAELGLTSLQNLSIVSAISHDLGDIPPTLLFDHASPAQVAAYLSTQHPQALEALFKRLRSG
ncbi:acyl carrier protein [Streptomyces sp. NPDC005283]|uniref:acyl carrier protein n=1 Tax=Streptomyces sp. NPDC005283 TaxID=3156871 RepID=UPI003456166C